MIKINCELQDWRVWKLNRIIGWIMGSLLLQKELDTNNLHLKITCLLWDTKDELSDSKTLNQNTKNRSELETWENFNDVFHELKFTCWETEEPGSWSPELRRCTRSSSSAITSSSSFLRCLLMLCDEITPTLSNATCSKN
jgi:hypothetical protein